MPYCHLERSDRAFTRPHTIRGTRLSTSSIYARWMAGEELYEIGADMGIEIAEVFAAAYFELGRRERWDADAKKALEVPA